MENSSLPKAYYSKHTLVGNLEEPSRLHMMFSSWGKCFLGTVNLSHYFVFYECFAWSWSSDVSMICTVFVCCSFIRRDLFQDSCCMWMHLRSGIYKQTREWRDSDTGRRVSAEELRVLAMKVKKVVLANISIYHSLAFTTSGVYSAGFGWIIMKQKAMESWP